VLAQEFYDRARPFLSDHETPLEVLEMLAFINRSILEKGAAARFVGAWARNERLERNGKRQLRGDDEIDRFLKRRPELKESFAIAVSAGILATSYGSRGWGWIARRMMANLLTNHPEVAGAVAESAMHRNGMPGDRHLLAA